MKYSSILTLVLTIILLTSACGTKTAPPPTISVADMQMTAAALAATMIAQTQATIPTATLPPPTETGMDLPIPTDTFLPLPASEVTPTPVQISNPVSENDCIYKAMPGTLEGYPIKIRLSNLTKAALTISAYLHQAAPQAQCGYRIYTVEAQQAIVITDLVEGCYSIWAWNPDPKHYFIVTNGTNCLYDSETKAFDISTWDIKQR